MQDKMRHIEVFGFGVSYIRNLTVIQANKIDIMADYDQAPGVAKPSALITVIVSNAQILL